MTTDEQLSALELTLGESYFENVYRDSPSMAALLKPAYDAFGRVSNIKLVTANESWHAARLEGIERGEGVAKCYSKPQLVLKAVEEACELGSATRFIQTAEDNDVIVGGLVIEVEWRLLPNGLILEQSRDQTLIAAALEASGPVLIVEMPEPGRLPEKMLGVNDAFIDLFDPARTAVLPTLSSGGSKEPVKLSVLRDSVMSHFTDSDWEHFFNQNLDIYTNQKDVKGLPFFMDGKAYFRDFSTHSLGDGRRVGIWVYRLAGQAEMGHPEFAAARLDGLYTHVLHLSRPIAAHRPVLNEDGEVIDISCVWANNAFQSYRFEPIQRGQLGTETRVRFTESLLPVVKRAWEEGEATQFFRFEDGDDETIYRDGYVTANFNSNLEMETYFTRTQDEYIIEWGDDVDMKRRLGSELEEQRATSYRMALETQKELSKRTEHDRFVRELHDNILQELFVTGLSINAISAAEAAEPLKEQLDTVHEAIAKISKDIRKLIAGSKDREGEPLNEQVADVVSYWDETVADVHVSLDEFLAVGTSHIERIPQDATTNIVNIVKESVSNAVKHSGGTAVKVELSILPQVIMVSIADNGKGIDPRNTRASGTLNMQARAESVGGTVEIRNSTSGVTVEATLPYELEVV